ncbi:MAG: BofC C-terminal domain-containing protein [Clostridia bacterium]|nr:BofC C-terminal domain-containing protein [Clostridia bacterium]
MSKNRFILLIFSIAASFFISGCARQMFSDRTSDENRSQTYTVKETNGYIGVFYGESKTPYEILDADISEFPPEDQLLLKNGITVNSREELNEVLEDYSE